MSGCQGGAIKLLVGVVYCRDCFGLTSVAVYECKNAYYVNASLSYIFRICYAFNGQDSREMTRMHWEERGKWDQKRTSRREFELRSL